jgi:hypothetical protein
MRTLSRGVLIFVAALAVGCSDPAGNGGGDGGNNTGPDGGNNTGPDGGNNTGPDGGNTGPDGGNTTPGCEYNAAAPQCSNCIDDDGDGLIDGADPHCISALDNDESSFATGIPGDNMDLVDQDCFFDGDSGAGNDGCSQHVCCILGAPDRASCPYGANRYNPANCGNLSQECIDFCSPISPPGCDCFGCCTQCNDTGCYDVYINPRVSPNCDVDVLQDPTKCLPCVKQGECSGGECGGCVLCPGQTEDDLPAECGGQNTCPGGAQTCEVTADCGAGMFCSNQCCIFNVP